MTAPAARALVWWVMVLLACAARAPAQQAESFQTSHYRVISRIDSDLAHRIARHADAVFAEYERRFRSFPARHSKAFPLYLFETGEDYLAFLRSTGVDGTNTGGMFFRTSDDDGLATFVRGQPLAQVLSTLQHEGFHQFAYTRIGKGLPPWVNEGIAEYFGAAYLARGRLVTGTARAGQLEVVQRAIREHTFIPFSELLAMTPEQWSQRVAKGDAKGNLQYDQAWSMVHYLIESGGERPAVLERYLRALSTGVQPKEALASAFGKNTADFEAAWEKYVLALEPDPVSTAAAKLDFLALGMAYLFEKGAAVDSFESLKEQLREEKFRARRWSPAGPEVVTAKDDASFEPPAPPAGTGGAPARKPPAFVVTPSKDPKLPPGLVVEGLRLKVRVQWSLDKSGSLRYEVMIE